MLNYKIFGGDGRRQWIVMIHGAGGSIEVWYKQVADFARHFNLLLVDLVGHGGSVKEALRSGFSFEAAADQVMEVVDKEGIAKAHFMGLSLGSIIVRVIADRCPDRVESMVLAGAVTRLNWKSRVMLRLAGVMKYVMPYRSLKWLLAKTIIPQRRYRNSMGLFLRNAKKVSFDNFLRWLKLGDNLNARIGRLFTEQLSIPTLYMMGEDDYLFLPQARMAARCGGAQASVVVVPEAGHVCNVDNKMFFNRASLDFLRDVSIR